MYTSPPILERSKACNSDLNAAKSKLRIPSTSTGTIAFDSHTLLPSEQNYAQVGKENQCPPQLSRLPLTQTHAQQHAALYSNSLAWTSARNSVTLSTKEGAIDCCLLWGTHVVVPKCLWTALLEKLHRGYCFYYNIDKHSAKLSPSRSHSVHQVGSLKTPMCPCTLVHMKQYSQKRLRRYFQKMRCGIDTSIERTFYICTTLPLYLCIFHLHVA